MYCLKDIPTAGYPIYIYGQKTITAFKYLYNYFLYFKV